MKSCHPSVLAIVMALSAALPIRDALAAEIASYSAALGTLPESQGLQREEDPTSPAPTVSLGALHQVPQTRARERQFWHTGASAYDFSANQYNLEIDLKVVSSNYLPNSVDGARFGYYFQLVDSSGRGYHVGISSGLISLTSTANLYSTVLPFDSTAGFHKYGLQTDATSATLSIDGIAISTANLAGATFSPLYGAAFGDISQLGVSETYLKTFSLSAVPEAGTSALFIAGLVALLLRRRLF